MSCHHSAQGIEGPLVFALSPENSQRSKTNFPFILEDGCSSEIPTILIFMDTPECFQMYALAGKEQQPGCLLWY